MSGPLALFLAFGGGLLSFLSPCTLPLVPGYLAFVSGLEAEEIRARDNAGIVLTATALFVLGFSLVFVASGATSSYLGSLVGPHRSLLQRVSGVFIIVMALFMLGVVRAPVLYGDRRLHLTRQWGMWSALPLGVAFGFGWTPCVGPILTSILLVSTNEASVQRGSLLLLVYSLGLGVPFLLMALFTERVLLALARFRRYLGAINLAGAGLLLGMGALLALNQWTRAMAPLMTWYAHLNLPS